MSLSVCLSVSVCVFGNVCVSLLVFPRVYVCVSVFFSVYVALCVCCCSCVYEHVRMETFIVVIILYSMCVSEVFQCVCMGVWCVFVYFLFSFIISFHSTFEMHIMLS